MANSDKVISAVPIVRMLKSSDNFAFSVINPGSRFFVEFRGQNVIECEDVVQATLVVTQLNSACSVIVASLKSSQEAKVGTLIA